MTFDANMRPKLRPVEAIPVPDADPGMVALHDPSGLSPTSLTVSEAALFVLSYFDGQHTLQQIADEFGRQFGKAVRVEQLEDIVSHVRQACLLDDESFEAHYQRLTDEYTGGPARVMQSTTALGIDKNIGRIFNALMNDVPDADGDANIVGLVAPHLDYPRGAPCYATAYAQLRNRPVPERVVILGTNHFGRSSSVAVTGKDFQTPLGTTRTDVEFIEQLESCCGDLRRFEFDHQREHSVELQVLWCQHLFGPERFTMVPVLCPDPCGPTGTRPHDGNGVDLHDFAKALCECIRLDGKDTLLIAGADLSHVGAHFGDDRRLDEEFLPEVRERDHRVLGVLEAQGPEAFLACVAKENNPTRICSAGCLFTLVAALPDAKTRMLKYHQAVHDESQTGVTCAAVVVTK